MPRKRRGRAAADLTPEQINAAMQEGSGGVSLEVGGPLAGTPGPKQAWGLCKKVEPRDMPSVPYDRYRDTQILYSGRSGFFAGRDGYFCLSLPSPERPSTAQPKPEKGSWQDRLEGHVRQLHEPEPAAGAWHPRLGVNAHLGHTPVAVGTNYYNRLKPRMTEEQKRRFLNMHESTRRHCNIRNQRTDTLRLGMPMPPVAYRGPTPWKKLDTETEYRREFCQDAP